MDRVAWWATVQRVSESRLDVTEQLSTAHIGAFSGQFFCFCFCFLPNRCSHLPSSDSLEELIPHSMRPCWEYQLFPDQWAWEPMTQSQSQYHIPWCTVMGSQKIMGLKWSQSESVTAKPKKYSLGIPENIFLPGREGLHPADWVMPTHEGKQREIQGREDKVQAK